MHEHQSRGARMSDPYSIPMNKRISINQKKMAAQRKRWVIHKTLGHKSNEIEFRLPKFIFFIL